MKYKTIFWDIDGTLYDNSEDIPKDERKILSKTKRLEKIPDKQLNYWIPYKGLVELMKSIPKTNQGIISNGIDHLQKDKILLLGLAGYINPKLIFTSYSEAEKELKVSIDQYLLHFLEREIEIYKVEDMSLKTQKPESYMFNKALQKCGISPEECVMIGNGWEDVLGAQRVGMKTIYISGTVKKDESYTPIEDGQIIPDHIIKKGDIKSLTNLLI